MNLNALKQYMEFFTKNGLGGADYSSGTGFNPTPFNPQALAATWAERQMGRDGENPQFFGADERGGNRLASYVRPERFAGQMPQPGSHASAMRPDIHNALALMLRGR